MKKFFLGALIVILSSQSFAQTQTSSYTGFRRGIATVMFAGLGGAVLGLSTLSFYGEPQEHIGNIWTGLALGVIGGATYVITQPSSSGSLSSQSQPSKIMTHKHQPQLVWAWNF